jgi:PBP1b-binding outer membrane lipoprotein LpoB
LENKKLRYNLFIVENNGVKLKEKLLATFDDIQISNLINDALEVDLPNIKLKLVDTKTGIIKWSVNEEEIKKHRKDTNKN